MVMTVCHFREALTVPKVLPHSPVPPKSCPRETQGERLPVSIKVGKSLITVSPRQSLQGQDTAFGGYSNSLGSLYSPACWLPPWVMRVITGKGRPRSKTKSSYFLDHWVGLRLGLCSRASYLELFA